MIPLISLVAVAVAPVVPLDRARGFASKAPDRALVERAKKGDRAAQSELYDRHAPRVLARVTRLLGRSGEAEDILQESFIAAFRDLGQLTCETRFGAWLTGIAVHLVHRRFRKRRLLRRLGLDRGVDDASLEALSRSASQEALTELRRVDQVLKSLDPDLRLAWMLRAVEGCDLAEVAEQCACSVATAKRRISAAQCAIEQVTRGISGEGLR